ncbi:hypothetical protein [Tumebacillus flagellatus]|uniref:ESAT-6-like protein n=1 Tax=Tumebacillus flagellatus TaxID=1157490 RepID=A0A074LKV6_9BACL|nr:hypothetical protein [Tumebacillus flagellatus]KEO82766.1 hypothetical protein EL26_13535 [Tumebacillus flagellatus]
MSEIQVSAENLHQEHYRNVFLAQDLRTVMHTINSQARVSWTGNCYDHYLDIFNKMNSFAEGIALALEKTAGYLEEAATLYDQAESTAKRQFTGSR